MEILQYLAPLGVGGILAAFIFMAYRKDAKKDGDERVKIVEEYARRLEHHINNQRMDRETLIDTLEKVNTHVSIGNELHRNLSQDMRDLIKEMRDRS